jgi:hypothetical protein
MGVKNYTYPEPYETTKVRIFCLLNLSWSLRWLPEPPRTILMISCGCVQGRLSFTHPSFFLNDFLRIALLEVQFCRSGLAGSSVADPNLVLF